MPSQNPDPGKIAAIPCVRRRDNSGKRHRVIIVIGKPPSSKLELRNARAIEKRQPMQVGEGVHNIVIVRVDAPNSVHEWLIGEE
jgi:hypothetical protein